MKKILFISHDASRSGAPFVLLYLLQWLKLNSSYKFDVLLLRDGAIKGEFEKVAGKVFVATEFYNEGSIAHRIKKKIGLADQSEAKIKKIGRKIDLSSYDLVYGNTIISLVWLVVFKKNYQVKTVIAIHELRLSMEGRHSIKYLSDNLKSMDLIIAGSNAVSVDIITRYSIPSTLIETVHAFIHTYKIPSDSNLKLDSANITSDTFVIGGVGNSEWRKGVDQLLPIGLYLKKHFPNFNFHLIWIGGNKAEEYLQRIIFDIEKAGLIDKISILENTDKYLDYINRFDLFAMLSREDPFPLVSLEAAFLEKPIVMFKGTGGTAELIKNGGGIIVDYLDTEAMGEKIFEISSDIEKKKMMGQALKKEVIEKYNSEVICRKVLLILEKFI